jgi:septum formation protein
MLILASQSPRRRELLKLICDDFVVEPADIDEKAVHSSNSELAKELSKFKAYEIFKKHPNDTVLAVDTVVIIDDEILGKPTSKEDAFNMLTRLSGRKHHVVSGFTIINKDKEINKSVVTSVYFNELTPELINKYIETGSPMDKAGAYGIQDEEFNLIKKIDGSYYNVVGLPIEAIKPYL